MKNRAPKEEKYIHRAIVYRLYPTPEQQVFFAKTFGCCRKVWNLMLSDRIEYYNKTGEYLETTSAQYKKAYPYLREPDSLALANVQLNLDQAYKAFFSNPSTGFPKFKSKRTAKKSYKTNSQLYKGVPTIEIFQGCIKLPKVGNVKAVIHRIPGEGWKLKSATITNNPDGTYDASILFEHERIDVQRQELSESSDYANVLGLDYRSDGLYMDSNGECCEMPHFFRNQQKRLAKEQRRLSRKAGARKGEEPSRNYLKQKQKVARIHAHTANQRRDFLQKKSTAITKQYDYVCVEDLNMKAMSNKDFGNGKATLDNGYGMFTEMLKYKLRAKGGELVKVNKWFPSSQICNVCGTRHSEMKDLKVRTMVCECGNVIDRDINATMNIKTEGIRILRS